MKIDLKKKCRLCGYVWISQQGIGDAPHCGVYVFETEPFCMNCGNDFGEEINETNI